MTYGVWNNAEKRFVFGIAAETPRKAKQSKPLEEPASTGANGATKSSPFPKNLRTPKTRIISIGKDKTP